jgi:hypothetical protein
MWTPSNWQAVFFHSQTVLNTNAYQSINFWINGGSTGGQSITFSLVTSGPSTSTTMFRYPIPTTSVKKNAWTQVSIKFVDLGFGSSAFDGFWFQANSANQQGTVYIDDVYFMHLHAGGTAALETPDLCSSVTCPGTHSTCLAGVCMCTDGYNGEDCAIAPTITDVTVESMAGASVTTLTAEEIVVISWNSTGAVSDVSIVIEEAGSSIPQAIVSQISNAGSYSWTVPADLAAGTYTIRVFFSSTVEGVSGSLTKTTAADTKGCGDCSGHGECDEDTAPLCICRFGYSPSENCTIAPSGVVRTRSQIIVKQAFSTYSSAPARFLDVVKADLATALLVHPDQIETVSGEIGESADSTVVTYDVLTGAQFPTSSLSINSDASLNAVISSQLGSSDSSLSRGTYQYEQEVQVATSPSSSTGSSTTPTSASTGTSHHDQVSAASSRSPSSSVSLVVVAVASIVAALL